MNDTEPSVRHRVWRGITLAANGAALVTLLAAVGLGLWSRFFATRVRLPDFDGYTPGPVRAAHVGHLAIIAAVVAVIVLLALVQGWRNPTEDGRRPPVRVMVATVLFLLMLVMTWTQNVPGRYGPVRANFVMAQDVPSAVAAWTLMLAGCLLAAYAAGIRPKATPMSRRGLTTVIAGAVVGALVSGLVVVAAVRAGDDGLNATTAADAPLPAVPKALGSKRFTVEVDSSITRPGGLGFIVSAYGGVRAYDSSGRERWHYQRRGPSEFTSKGPFVFDDGRTVLVPYESAKVDGRSLAGHVVALDAVTGAVLWTSYDPAIRTALQGDFWDWRASKPYLMRRDGDDTWTRIDTRTGNAMWSWDLPKDCGHRAVAQDQRLALVSTCQSGVRITMSLLTVDAATGAVAGNHEIIAYTPEANATRSSVDVQVVGLGGRFVAVGDFLWYGAPDDARGWRAIDITTGTELDLPAAPLVSTGAPGGAALTAVSRYPRAIVDLRDGPRLAVRCTFETPGSDYGDRAVWLDDQVVYETGDGLTAFSRTDCAPTPVAREPGKIAAVYPAPGALLVVRQDGARTFVDGYSA